MVVVNINHIRAKSFFPSIIDSSISQLHRHIRTRATIHRTTNKSIDNACRYHYCYIHTSGLFKKKEKQLDFYIVIYRYRDTLSVTLKVNVHLQYNTLHQKFKRFCKTAHT